MKANSDQPRLSVQAAAEFLGVHRSFLDRRRVEGGGPEFLQLSSRKVVYERATLERWIDAQRRRSTSDTR
jgi:predicted DNA-binding transcriptional regulator AlpA